MSVRINLDLTHDFGVKGQAKKCKACGRPNWERDPDGRLLPESYCGKPRVMGASFGLWELEILVPGLPEKLIALYEETGNQHDVRLTKDGQLRKFRD